MTTTTAESADNDDAEFHYLNAVIIGNVNAGKSSLCGRIAYHLGYVSGSELLEYRQQALQLQRESYYLAWYSDRADIEREQGITIHNHYHCWEFAMHLNNADTDTDADTTMYNLVVNITDISGNDMYLKNAITGCALNELAILLIDIDDQHLDIKGIQQLPRQHYMGSVLQQLLIIKALGIGRIIVVLNKCDLFLRHLSNFQTYISNIKNTIVKLAHDLNLDLEHKFYPYIIPISTTNGWNICSDYLHQKQHFLAEHVVKCVEMDAKLDTMHDFCALYQQQQQQQKQTLLEVLSRLDIDSEQASAYRRRHHKLLKATIKRVSITKHHLVLLYCIVVHGVIRIGQQIRVHPFNITVPIYSIQSFKKTITCAFPGQLICIAIKISDIDPSNLNVSYNIDNINHKFITRYFQRGSLITQYTDENDALFGPIEYFEAELDVIYAPYDLKLGYQLSCFSHCLHFRANLVHCFDKSVNDIECMDVDRSRASSSRLSDCTHLCSGEKCVVGFNVIDKQIVLLNHDDYPSMGWIVIKDHKSYIVAIGKILYCGRKVSRLQIYNAIHQIPVTALTFVLTTEIVAIIAEYACCGL